MDKQNCVHVYYTHITFYANNNKGKCLNDGAGHRQWAGGPSDGRGHRQAIEKNSTHAGKAERKALSHTPAPAWECSGVVWDGGGQNKGTSSLGPN